MLKARYLLLILALAAIIPITSFAQHSTIDPRQPRWGQTVTVSYDPASSKAKLDPATNVHLVVELIFPEETRFRSYLMQRVGSIIEARFEIPARLSAMRLHFVTLDGGWDQSAFLSAMISRADGKPARGASQSRIPGGDYAEYFKQELDLYPDNYSAYRLKWSLALDIEGEKAGRLIASDLAKLERIRTRTPELLAVLSFGHSLFSIPEKSRELTRILVAQHPDSPFTAQAISDIELRYADQEMERDRGRELLSWKLAVLEKAPSSEHSRRMFADLAGRPQLPVLLSETITESWIRDEPDNPLAPFSLALAYSSQYQKYDRALAQIEKSIDLTIAGRLRLYGDISGAQTRRLMGQSYLIKADLLLRTGKYDAAITTVKVAQTFDHDPRFAAHLLEARILWAAGRKDAAERAYLEAWRRGSQEALERLRTGFQEKNGRTDGFDSYLSDLQVRADDQSGVKIDKRPLPQFRTMALDGSAIDLNALQGKIVVINLWFIACGPCRKEIPALNQLAVEFKGKNVVFLAPSPDSADALHNFLAQMPFAYRIIPDAEDLIHGVFQASTFPTHLVINRDGQVEAVFVGGGGDRPSEVRREVLRLLNGQ